MLDQALSSEAEVLKAARKFREKHTILRAVWRRGPQLQSQARTSENKDTIDRRGARILNQSFSGHLPQNLLHGREIQEREIREWVFT